jgi:hypothetical protein
MLRLPVAWTYNNDQGYKKGRLMAEQHKHDGSACTDCRCTRKEFLDRILKRTLLVGAVLSAPKVVDKFLVPPAYAMPSTQPKADRTGGGADH